MSSKKRVTYRDLSDAVAELQIRMEREKERVAAAVSEAFVTNDVALKLGDLSSRDLKRVMKLLAEHVDECLEQLENEKSAKK